ncbi:MAG: Hint domain-containing protein [Pseudomonadota bacterium]
MARISELHYSDALAASSGIAEFVEVSLAEGEDPADFAIALYNQDGRQAQSIPLTAAPIEVFTPSDTTETHYVIDGPDFGFLLTDPNAGGTSNNEAVALVNTTTGEVVQFFDIGGGTSEIEALDGLAQGTVSVNLPTETPPNQAQGSLQFNQPDPDTLVTQPISRGSSGIICFAAGSLIDTPQGARPVETLRVGDLVQTADNGVQPIRWIGQRTVAALGTLAPVVIAGGAHGAERPLTVSPQHRILIRSPRADLMFGEAEVLIPAIHLVDGRHVARRQGGEITYVHLLFDRHEVIFSSGVASESFHPSARNISTLENATRAEVLTLFPELASGTPPFDTARLVLTGAEARVLHRAGGATRPPWARAPL